MTVRQLAAVDMYGARGTLRRRRIILAEFVLGAIGCVALGLAAALPGSPGPVRLVLGLWLAGVGLNYVPLAAYAIRLSRPGALEAELAGVDVPRELRRYATWQLWVAVPLLFVVLALRSEVTTDARPGGSAQPR